MRTWQLLAVLAVGVAASPARATDWYLTARSASGESVSFVDRDSIRSSGEGLRRAQVYIVLRQTMPDGTAALDGLMEFDCGTAQRRYVRITGFDERGVPLRTEEGGMRWTPIIAGSVDAAGRQFVCSGGTEPGTAASFGSAYPFAAGRERMAASPGK